MFWSSKKGYTPQVPALLLIMCLMFLVESKYRNLYLYAAILLLSADLLRYLLLRYWEGERGVAGDADERSTAISFKAGQQSFWVVMLLLWLWLGAGRTLGLDPTQSIFWVFVSGLVFYLYVEFSERRRVGGS